jgi:hypothetical protein
VGFVREEHTPYRSASAIRHSAVRQYAARRFVLGRGASPLGLSPTRSRARRLPPSLLRASVGQAPARSVRVAHSLRSFARRKAVCLKKSGVQSLPSHPPYRSAAVSASFRPFSCRPLRSSSPLVPPWNVAAQLLPVTRGYNRWAERSTLIQDVDYG